MKRIIVKINILILFALFFLGVNPVFAESGLVVDFQDEPLFKEANFVPNESITKWIKVTNNSGEGQVVAVSVINPSSCSATHCLSDAINFIIKNGEKEFFNNTLAEFFDAGEVVLEELNNGDTVRYNFVATFEPKKGNEYQSLSAGFDLLVGFQGGIFLNGDTFVANDSLQGFSGGGNGPPLGLIIKDEVSILLTLDSVKIEWNTSYPATSQVIYREEGQSYSLDLSSPNYGYPLGTSEDLHKSTSHSVLLTGLEVGKTYYYRAVSHASPATVGQEHSFTIPTLDEVKSYLSYASLAEADNKDSENFNDFSENKKGAVRLADGGLLILEDRLDSGDTSRTTGENSENTKVSDKKDNNNLALISFLSKEKLFGINYWWWLLIVLIILILLYFLNRE